MLPRISFYFGQPTDWPRLIILSSSLFIVLFYGVKRISYLLDHPKKNVKRKKETKMRDEVSKFFNEFLNYEKRNNVQVLMQNEEKCKEKILQMIDGGIDFLQVISDFDRTISSYMCNGKPNLTCHGVFETDPELSQEVKQQFDNLRNKYYKIEVDSTISDEEKIPYMNEWWTKVHDLMVDSRLHKDVLETTVRQCELKLRNRCPDFMETLNSHEVPMLIFSAGIGNVILEILKYKNLSFENVRIVSNFMNFNNEGILTGFQDDVIHTFNKSAKAIQNSEFYENICTKRSNVILMGDSTGDPQMSDGLSEGVNVLKIGFLNSNVENLKEKYMAIYDMVLVNDDSFSVPMQILELIINS